MVASNSILLTNILCSTKCNIWLSPLLPAAVHDSSVGIETRYRLCNLGIESRWVGWGRARFSTPVQTGPGAYPASCTMGKVKKKSIYCKTQCTFRRHNNSINITYTINMLHVSAFLSYCIAIAQKL